MYSIRPISYRRSRLTTSDRRNWLPTQILEVIVESGSDSYLNAKQETTYSTEGVENYASARPPNLTWASYDLDLWPPNAKSWTFSSPCPVDHLRQFAAIRFIQLGYTKCLLVLASLATEHKHNYRLIFNLLYMNKISQIRHFNTKCDSGPVLLSRRSRQRERLSATMLSICSSVCLSPECKTRFSQKLSNLELWSLLTTYRKL